MPRWIAIAAATASLLAGMNAQAQFQKPEDAIKYRQAALTVIGNHLTRVAAMVQGRVPFDPKVAAENAAIVNSLSKLPWAAFGEGTDKGAPTRSKPEVWKDAAKFKELANKMVVEAEKLDAAAKTGKLDAIKAAIGPLGSSCKSCHDDFRAEKFVNN